MLSIDARNEVVYTSGTCSSQAGVYRYQTDDTGLCIRQANDLADAVASTIAASFAERAVLQLYGKAYSSDRWGDLHSALRLKSASPCCSSPSRAATLALHC